MQLYQSADLLAGYVKGKPESYVETWDFQQFAGFIKAGGPTTSDEGEALRQAEHDARINVALGDWLRTLAAKSGCAPKLVGIMGSCEPTLPTR